MESVTADPRNRAEKIPMQPRQSLAVRLKKWINTKEPGWEYNRLGIASAGIFLQVTVAGAMIGILSLAGAHPLLYSGGILLAFLANSVVFAQAPMRWVLGFMAASILFNLLVTLYYGILLLL